MNLSEHVHKGIIELAEKYGIEKVILFGIRVRGDNWERSDVDLDRGSAMKTCWHPSGVMGSCCMRCRT